VALDFVTMAPTAGDGRYLGVANLAAQSVDGWSAGAEREPSLEYIGRIARATEEGGFSTLLLPVGSGCLDGWGIASALIPLTQRLRFMLAVRPGFVQPAVAARQATTFDYLSGGRLSINVVTGGSPDELARDGDFLDHAGRYRRTREFVRVLKDLFERERLTFEGEFFHVEDAKLHPRFVQRPRPPFYIAGASEEGIRLAAEEADVYMLWGETLERTRERIQSVRAAAERAGRADTLRYSLSFQVILGDSEDDAWRRAEDMLSRLDPAVASRQAEWFSRIDSVGQQRLVALMQGAREQAFRLGPNLWAGLTQVMSGNSIALVGSPDQVAERLHEYLTLGFDTVLLRGFPHLETIQAIGREIIPRLRRQRG
jgi:alkanesulfonate monooxygenase